MSQIPSNWGPIMQPNPMLLSGSQFLAYGAPDSNSANFAPTTTSKVAKRPRENADKENVSPKRLKKEYETSSEVDDEEIDDEGESHENEDEEEEGESDSKTPPQQPPPSLNQHLLGNPLAHSTPYTSTGLYNNINSQWGNQFASQSYSNLFPMSSNLNDPYSNQLLSAQQMAYNFGYPGTFRPQNWGVTSPGVSSAMAYNLNSTGAFPFVPNRSNDSGILAETTNSSDESSGSIKSDAVNNYNDQQNASSEKGSNGTVFCTVPGRLTLLSNTKKYKVTLQEILRRINAPECLNASLLGGILRKAKNKDGGKALRQELQKHGIILPSGRRKSVPTTVFTALCEEEATAMARDFDELSKKCFPIRELATVLIQATSLNDDAHRRRYSLIQTSIILKELLDVLKTGLQEPNPAQPMSTMSEIPAQKIKEFSMLTHGFGGEAHRTSWELLHGIINEAIVIMDGPIPSFVGNMTFPPYAATQGFNLGPKY